LDPVATAQAASDFSSSPMATGAVVFLAMGLMKIIEVLIEKVGGRSKDDASDVMASIASSLARVSEAQDRLASKLGSLDMRFAEHDKADAVIFSRMSDTLNRIEDTADGNGAALVGFAKDHSSALKKLDEMDRAHQEHDRRVMEAVALQKQIRDAIKV
jgi:ABC-type transporter Mla subunit MlaD